MANKISMLIAAYDKLIPYTKWVYSTGKEASEAAAQIEQYNTSVKATLGSTGAARDRMQEYSNLARKIPFTLVEVVAVEVARATTEEVRT